MGLKCQQGHEESSYLDERHSRSLWLERSQCCHWSEKSGMYESRYLEERCSVMVSVLASSVIDFILQQPPMTTSSKLFLPYCKAHGFLQTWDTLFHLILLKGELHIWFNPHNRWTRFYISPVFRSVVIQLVGRIRGVNFNQISAICLLNSKTEKEQQLNGRFVI